MSFGGLFSPMCMERALGTEKWGTAAACSLFGSKTWLILAAMNMMSYARRRAKFSSCCRFSFPWSIWWCAIYAQGGCGR